MAWIDKIRDVANPEMQYIIDEIDHQEQRVK
jgi:hypothetical protein